MSLKIIIKAKKFCATCDELVTVEALFNVGDGVTLIEKYCDLCTKRVR